MDQIFSINCRSSDGCNDRITGAFDRSGAPEAVALDRSKGFDRI